MEVDREVVGQTFHGVPLWRRLDTTIREKGCQLGKNRTHKASRPKKRNRTPKPKVNDGLPAEEKATLRSCGGQRLDTHERGPSVRIESDPDRIATFEARFGSGAEAATRCAARAKGEAASGAAGTAPKRATPKTSSVLDTEGKHYPDKYPEGFGGSIGAIAE